MRSRLVSLALFSLACVTARAGGVTLKRVWPQWYSADSFQSLYEYHTGRELKGDWTVLRSRPDDRGGLYFLTRVENPGAQVLGATFVLNIIAPDSTITKVFNFPADIPKGSRLFELGLTGKDWAGSRILPVAWELELRAPDGSVLARKTSYLWEKSGT